MRFLVRVCAASLLMTLVGAPLRAQSLADVARQEEERRKHVKDGGKVYTNKDLKPVPAPVIDADQPAAAKAPEKDAGAAAKDKDNAKDKDKEKDKDTDTDKDKKDAEPVKDQKYWADRMRTVLATLDRDQTYADALQSRVNQLTADFVNRDDPAQRAVITTDRL